MFKGNERPTGAAKPVSPENIDDGLIERIKAFVAAEEGRDRDQPLTEREVLATLHNDLFWVRLYCGDEDDPAPSQPAVAPAEVGEVVEKPSGLPYKKGCK